MGCTTVCPEGPRKLMVCTGPPSKESYDGMLAGMVSDFDGTVLICGGTTAGLLARRLKREITVDMKRDPSGLPPTSAMEGVALVTEGVLTLTKVKSLLDADDGRGIMPAGTAGTVAGIMLGHDIIEFVVGTRINILHRDPSLPVKLEYRGDLVKAIASLLVGKFSKKIRIIYI